MNTPTCRDSLSGQSGCVPRLLSWLAGEPFRVFFASGVLWSVIAAALWPMYYGQWIGFYPGQVHARLMVQAFGGACVTGFLSTAVPRLIRSPCLNPAELVWLLAWHLGGATLHLLLHPSAGDLCFLVLMASLMLVLCVRVAVWRKDPLPPQWPLALSGLVCGLAGTGLLRLEWVLQAWPRYRLAHLLVYQGFFLPLVLGIGAFVLPRLLGQHSGNATPEAASRRRHWQAGLAALLIGVSFPLEAFGWAAAGFWLRAVVAAAYLLAEVRWRKNAGDADRGPLFAGLLWALGLGWAGLILAGFRHSQHVSIEHLLYIGGFGMTMLILSSHVLLGQDGNSDTASRGRRWIRAIIFLGVLAATTRATPAWFPTTSRSHHIYAAWTWGLLGVIWLVWHSRRLMTRPPKE